MDRSKDEAAKVRTSSCDVLSACEPIWDSTSFAIVP